MKLTKLPWAGIRVTAADGSAVAVDPLFHPPAMFGEPREPMVPLETFGPVDAVLVTHLHDDHFDPQAIAAFYGADIPVYMPEQGTASARARGLTNVTGAAPGQTFVLGRFELAAAPSVDGIGDPQIAWIVGADGRRIIHCGDTLWHGYWWRIAAEHAPFAAACLPVNAAVIAPPGRTPSGQPISMSPEQAVSAAALLQADALVPIHYGVFHAPPAYAQTDRLEDRLNGAASGTMDVKWLKTGESIGL